MRIVISGTVQGVGFRPAVYRAAVRCGASGTVWNNGSDVCIETDLGDRLLGELMSDLPPLASVDSVEKFDSEYAGGKGFSIIPSGSVSRGASIPADSAVCGKCVAEIFGNGRRSMYPFTTCTNCGPRFTLLKGMPYDRPLTSMDGFPMCDSCGREYSDPGDRRFHHQTVCCPDCGPEYRFEYADGTVSYEDPIGRFAGLMDSGGIGIVKGWGGMHICCNLETVPRLREWYGRKNKPFAVMTADIEAARRYSVTREPEERELESPHRPVVLVRKKDSEITENLSPGLDNIGVFLPYAGVHHILFSLMEHDALVMTSANVPGEPIVIEDCEARKLGADGYLFHNQPVINRADDSVVRFFGKETQFIRRSRGYLPFGLGIPFKGCAAALGAQENLTGCVAYNGKLWPTQHIGNGEKLGIPEYLEEAVRTQIDLLNCRPELVAIDRHPGYSNRKIAKRLAGEFGCEVMEIQHHWAHSASLLADNSLDSCTVLALDGTGSGDDGTAWGGEVLYADYSSYHRTTHLEPIPLLGSERALYDLRRLGFAIDFLNNSPNSDFSDSEAALFAKIMDKSVKSSSMGRLLDSLSFCLGVCRERTYDGEPAMRLEPLLNRGKLIEGFETETSGGVVKTIRLLDGIRDREDKADVAYTIVHNVIGEMVERAADVSSGEGISTIGITGGVSYNSAISAMFSEKVRSLGFEPVHHRSIPNGDGGISAGQAAIAARRLS